MLREYYSEILEEFEDHIEKRKELLEKVIEITQNDKVDDLELEDFETEVSMIEDLGFQRSGIAPSPRESVVLREVHDFVKSFKRLDYFYDLDRSFFYSESEKEYENMDNILDFKRSTISGKL